MQRLPDRRHAVSAPRAAPGGVDARLGARTAGAQTHHLPLFTIREAERVVNKSYIQMFETLSFYETNTGDAERMISIGSRGILRLQVPFLYSEGNKARTQ